MKSASDLGSSTAVERGGGTQDQSHSTRKAPSDKAPLLDLPSTLLTTNVESAMSY